MSVVEANEVEYQAALTGCGRVDASAREQLRVVGPDAASFLQGMVTNDVESLAVGASCYAAALTVKGAMVGDMRVLRRADDFVIDTGPGRGASIRDFLSKYLISEEAEIHDAPELAVVSLVGPQANEVRSRVPAALVLGALESPLGGVDLLVPRAELAAVQAALASTPVLSTETLEVLRVERGVPQFGVDMTEVTIPLEANLDRAIHYKKGCYIGQEVIARATFRGQMNKRLVQLLVGTASPAAKTELRLGDRKVGWITSVVRSPRHGENLALGYVHRDFLTPGSDLELGSDRAKVVGLAEGRTS